MALAPAAKKSPHMWPSLEACLGVDGLRRLREMEDQGDFNNTNETKNLSNSAEGGESVSLVIILGSEGTQNNVTSNVAARDRE